MPNEVKPMVPVHIHHIQELLGQCRLKRPVTPFQEHGNAMMAAVKRGDVVYLVNEEGCTHLNAAWNLRKALIEAGWNGFVESIFRVGTRQSASGQLDWGPHVCGPTETPLRIPAAFTAAAPAVAQQ